MWHCPHCGAPQAETARCWVCRKSSTTCSTCRHFQPSLVSAIGFCALDRARRPLTGRELRGCWTQRGGADADGADRSAKPNGALPSGQPTPLRGFIPIEDVAAFAATVPEAPESPPTSMLADALDGGEAGTSLFGNLDR